MDNKNLDKIMVGLLGLEGGQPGISRQEIVNDLIDPTKAYLGLIKNRLPNHIQKELDSKHVVLQEGSIWHAYQTTSISGIVNIIQPDHKTGPFWSSLNKGQTDPESIFILEAFRLEYSLAADIQNISWQRLYAMNILWLSDVEIKVGDKVIFDGPVSMLKSEYIKSGTPVWDMYSYTLQYPIVLLPNTQLRINIKVPDGLSATAPDGNFYFIRFVGMGIKTYKI